MPRGGKREGAGPPSQGKKTKSFRLRPDLIKWLEGQPDQTKIVEKGIGIMMTKNMAKVGATVNGEPLLGYESNGVRRYYLEGKLVAVATGNLEEISFTKYFCLPGIWEPDNQTSIVGEAKLAQML